MSGPPARINMCMPARLLRQEASVDRKRMSGHHRCGRARKVDHPADDIIHLGNAAKRRHIFHSRQQIRIVGQGFNEICPDPGRCDGVDPDVVWRPFHRQRAGEIVV